MIVTVNAILMMMIMAMMMMIMLRKYSGYEKFTPHTECAIHC
jgi:hypothetical protein